MAEKDNDTALSSGVYADLQSLVKLQYEARGFSFLPKQPVHSILSGRHNSRLRGRGMDFEEVRHYQRGDDIRSIDWNVTARTGTPFVKIFEEERELTVMLVVDVSGHTPDYVSVAPGEEQLNVGVLEERILLRREAVFFAVAQRCYPVRIVLVNAPGQADEGVEVFLRLDRRDLDRLRRRAKR